jgi:hypothetical protein
MMHDSIDARRRALRSDIASTRAAAAARAQQARATAGAVTAIAALLPRRWRWLGVAVASFAVVRALRARSSD